jgi:hypothetical protein
VRACVRVCVCVCVCLCVCVCVCVQVWVLGLAGLLQNLRHEHVPGALHLIAVLVFLYHLHMYPPPLVHRFGLFIIYI